MPLRGRCICVTVSLSMFLVIVRAIQNAPSSDQKPAPSPASIPPFFNSQQVTPVPGNKGKKTGCGVPNMVKTVPITEPERFAGHWYKHRHSGLKTLNQFVDHIPLNRTGLAFTNIPATGMLLHISQYNSVNDTDCVYRLFLGLFGHNGQCPGKALSSVDSDIPVTNNINMLYVDYDRVTIAYICRSTNYKTGFCDHPVFHVLTRARPDKMPAKELKAIDDLVDQTLAPYCLTAADVDPQMYSDARPFCKPADLGDTCAFRAMTALTEDINNSTQYQYKEIKP